MIYIYDIILNWTDNDKVYEFFEWEQNDDVDHIKKIPLFKIGKDVFDKLVKKAENVDLLNKDNIHEETHMDKEKGIIKRIKIWKRNKDK